jgi:hypothetical protein
MYRLLPILLVSSLSSVWGSEEHFEKHIRPLLLEHCIKCHGPEKQKGGLRLDSAAGWKVGGDSGPAIVPGDVAASRLMKAVAYTDRDLKMPPDGKLPAEAVSALEQWITLGAHDPRKGDVLKGGAKVIDPRQHWAFQLPKDLPPPAVKDGAWVKNPIDHFILAKLEAAKLSPAPAADPAILARRLSYDLTGLPGRGADLTALIDSPRFAERWAQHWLDAARFAESSGGGRTLPFKDAWRFRDYVIQSIQDEVPLDRFIQEQIAGDLMPHESPEQRRRQLTATGYLVLGAHNYEEQDKDLLRMDIVDEQLDTLGKSLLGMTITCARCHDHKFDPIPTRDYYALAGILRSSKVIRDPKENVAHWVDAPLPLDGPAEAEMQEHEALVKTKEQALAQAKRALKKLAPKTEPKDGDRRPVAVDELPGIVVDESQATQVGTWKHSTRYPTYVGDGYLHDDNMEKGELSLTYIPRITKGGRYEVRFSYTSIATRATNVPINILHADGETDVVVDQSVVPPIDARFISLGQYRFEANDQGFVMVSNEGTTGHVTADAVTFIPVEELDALADAKDKSQSNPEIAAATAKVKELEADLRKLAKKLPPRPQAMVIAEHEEHGDTKVHIRGNIRNLGEVVPRGFIQAAFHEKAPPQMPADQSGRLQLAQWLTSARNPLTARVLANRVWMHLFGEGLVRTVDNFGTTGEAPTHPELLDHLALYLQRNHWSLKSLVRYIVESSSYRMASRPSPLAADPDNRLLHSQRRRRLDANALRDTLLATAGTLDLGFLGPNIQNAVDAPDSNNTEVLNLEYGYVFADTRRSVYTPAFRNKRHELFDAFDFNDVNQSLTKRNTSSVSPQALYLLNNAFVIDVSRKAAEQLTADTSIKSVYHRILGRSPTAKERQLCQDFLSTQPSKDDWALLIQNLFASPDFRFLD